MVVILCALSDSMTTRIMLNSSLTPHEPIMEGTMWKWTNYLSGWQPRWFILEAGALSYYLSPNEVHLGSRGSLKIASCDITVHPTDPQRMDMVMPGGRQIFLRAASRSERQQWLIALGVAKQGGVESDSGDIKDTHTVAMEKKMAELHSNCQFLVSQITSIRNITSDLLNADSEVLSDLSSKVSLSCSQFLDVLQECMNLAHASHSNSSPLPLPLQPLPLQELYGPKKGGGLSPVAKKSSSSSFSESELYLPSPSHPPPPSPLTHHPRPKKNTPTVSEAMPTSRMPPVHEPDGPLNPDPSPGSILSDSKSASDLFITPVSSPQTTPQLSPNHTLPSRIGDRVRTESAESARIHDTFFSSLSFKFEDLELVEGAEKGEGHIPTEEFLQCCQAVVPFFDTLNSTAFAPVKADINGNITKLRAKLNMDPVRFSTLQSMVEAELEENTLLNKNSATDALLWLKRAMEFVQHFIGEVCDGEKSLDVAAGKAYTHSLRRYHGWIIRGIFNLAVKAVPYHKDFLLLLGSLGTEDGEKQVMSDMTLFSASLGEIVNIVNSFYAKHDLNPPINT